MISCLLALNASQNIKGMIRKGNDFSTVLAIAPKKRNETTIPNDRTKSVDSNNIFFEILSLKGRAQESIKGVTISIDTKLASPYLKIYNRNSDAGIMLLVDMANAMREAPKKVVAITIKINKNTLEV